MKNFIHSILLFTRNLFFCALLLTVFSCSNSIIGEIDTSEIKASLSSISSPKNLVASHGGYRKISLTWTKVSNAKQYFVYKANSPFETFEKIGETNGNLNEFDYAVEPGTSCWFRISAISYSEKESSLSSYVSGSSMAIPNITSIDLGTDGTSATISWWMNNCSDSTYEDSVKFEILCYRSDKLTQVGDTLYAEGSTRSVSISGLENKTTYYYLVKSYVGGGYDENLAEKSDFADAETARLTTPSAPENLESEQGISTESSGNGIKISWILSEAVDVKVSSGIYEEHPLYFTIERKLLNESDAAYISLASYIGTFDSSKASTSSASEIYFTCDKDANFGKNDVLKVELGDTTEDSKIPNYENYRVGAKISYTDKSVVAGKQYTYRIRSYADDVGNKKISSDSSYRECNAWLISKASLELNSEYKKSENSTKFTSIGVNFNFDFEDFGLDDSKFYTYVLTYQRTPFETSGSSSPAADEEKFLANFSSLEELKTYTQVYNSEFLSLLENQGYYSYKVYICSSSTSATENTSIPSKYYEMISSSNFCSITDDSTKLPVIENFEVSDGYASKYVLKWDYDSACTYTIQWTEYDGTTEQPLSSSTQSLVLSTSDFTTSENNGTTYATYNHSATSGDARKYTLIADNGLKTTKSLDSIYKTLGTANVSMAKLAYDSITVNWLAVQRADEYEVSAYYADDESKTELLVSSGEGKNTEITPSDDGKTYTCKITKPRDYDSALKSGKAIILKVTAKNSALTDDNTTEGTASVCTFGPALVNASVGNLYDNNIHIKWNKVDGAVGYIIYRVLYSDSSADNSKIETSTDKYYYDVSNAILKRNGDSTVEGSNVSYVESSATYTLNDIDDSSCADETSINQRKISWGLPFGYIILPVLNDSDDFEFESGKLAIKSGEDVGKAGVSYSDIASDNSPAFVKNATFGYGLNVAAEKSVSGTSQVIKWDSPYYAKDNAPTILRRLADSTENSWTVYKICEKGENSTSCEPIGEERYNAYEYAVKYRISASNVSVGGIYKASSSYVEKLSKIVENRYSICTEQLNKGYLLALKFTALTGSSCSEQIVVSPWDYAKRAIGPNKAELYITNYNLLNPTVKVASYDVENFTIPEANFETLKDTTLSSADYSLRLEPTAIKYGSSGTTDGVLKVLRDAKHYYKIELTSENGKATEAGDGSVYAYRNITDEELVKAAMLNIAYAFYLNGGGKSDYSNVTNRFKYGEATSPTGTTFTKGVYHYVGKYIGKYDATYTLTNYTPSQLTPSEKSTTFLSLTSDSSSAGVIRISGKADYYTYQFAGTEVINVKNAETSDNALSYDATITFTCTDNKTLSIKLTRNGSTSNIVSTKTEEERKKWFPMYLDGDKEKYYVLKSSTYGWWPSED